MALDASLPHGFCLSHHRASGHYTKQVNGKRLYLGRDPHEAWATWLAHRDAFMRGEDPRPRNGGPRVRKLRLADACNLFLEAKDGRVQAGEMKPASFSEYRGACRRLLEYFGRDVDAGSFGPTDFTEYKAAISKVRKTPKSLGSEIQCVRSLFIWLRDNGKIQKAVFGTEFKRPGRRALRRHARQKNVELLQPNEIVAAINLLGVQERACALLGISCGFYPSDCETLARSAVDFEAMELRDTRPKTETDRRAPLWPEVVEAMQLAGRFLPDDRGTFFVINGRTLSTRFTSALTAAGCHPRQGTTFKFLRHTFATVARETGDDAATRIIMGHADESILHQHYTHRFPRERLDRVSEHVRQWLFGGIEQ